MAVALDPAALKKIEELRERLKDNPVDSQGASQLAALYVSVGKKRDAVHVLSRTGAILLKRGRPLDAIALYKKVSQIDPKNEITSTFMVTTDLKRLLEATQGDAVTLATTTAATPAGPDGAIALPGSTGATPMPMPLPDEIRRKKEAIRGSVPGIPLLKDIPVFQFELVLDKLHLRSFAAGETIVREGDPGSTLLFVVFGEVAVLARGDDGRDVALAVLGPGDVAGEISFLSGLPRSATLTATAPTEVLELERKAIDQIVRKARGMAEALNVLFRERVLDQVLARSRVFGSLPREERDAVAKQMENLTIAQGESVIAEGERDDVLYLVKNGEARVFTARSGSTVELARLGPHEIFGEFAALHGMARTASVQAATPMELLKLSRADLADLVARQPAVKAALEEIQLERFVARSQALTK